MRRLSILLIERSFIIREGIRTLLSQMNQPFSMEEISWYVDDLPKLIRKTNPNLVIVNPELLGTGVILPRNFSSKAMYVGLLTNESELKTMSKFDVCIDIESDKQTLIRQLDEQITKNFNTHKTQHNNTLSDRENSILTLVARGMTNNDIAGKLYISTHTVMTHRKNITRKLGIKTVAGLTVFAIINKLIKAEEL